VLYILDPSPKLPSATVINHLVLKKSTKVVLIREKLSRLSPKVTLDNSIMMELEFASSNLSQVIKTPKTKIVELKTQMDPSNLAEQAVSLNLKLMKWRQAPELDLEIL
jgi:ubiquitin-like modifier-activating enzyme ATG7